MTQMKVAVEGVLWCGPVHDILKTVLIQSADELDVGEILKRNHDYS